MRGQVSKQRDAGEILRFAREQSRRLVGEHIVAPYAWAVDDGMSVIALELIAGGSLRTLSGDHGPLAEGTIVTVLDQVLDALATVHAAGIVHRDVTCGNILVRSTGFDPIDVALTDFGIAIALADARLTTVGSVVGTPGYLPPEVLRGQSPPRPAQCLLAADPESRPSNVEQVRALLKDALRDPLARDRAGDAVEIMEKIDVEGDDTRRTQLSPASMNATTIQSAVADTDARDAGSSSADDLPVVEGSAPAEKSPSRRRGLVAIAAASAVLIGSLGTWWAVQTQTEPEQRTTRSTPAPPNRTPTADPSIAGPAIVEAGDECGWLTEGDLALSPDGATLECVLSEGAYRWLEP